MTTTTTERIRAWQGPMILSFGFRPFFLLAGIWAVLAMALWIPMIAGRDVLLTAFDPFTWHAHEFVFGYTSAVITGFLLTAVPNWTGRLPVVGWPLFWLVALWIAGRIVISCSSEISPLAVAVVDLAEIAALAAMLGREIVAGRNWRNLPVLGILGLFLVANGLFHAEAAGAGSAFDGYGLRLGVGAVIGLIALIGGRIIPSFTRNWLVQRQVTALPVPANRRDLGILIATGAGLVAFVLAPDASATGWALVLIGLAHLWRLSRWQGLRTGSEALVWVLHVAYAMLALGFVGTGLAPLAGLSRSGTMHLWLAGAIGLMTLAVMTRAALGHTGRPLHAGPATTACYLGLILSVVARIAAVFAPDFQWLLHLAGLGWIGGFGIFVVAFWPVFTRPRLERKRASRAAG